jgi:hypothetical protein
VTETERYLPAGWPLPKLDEFNRPFFTSGALMLQQCKECGVVQHPAGEICDACGGSNFEYVKYAATGTVSSYTIVHHPPHPILRELVPYNVVIVQLDSPSHLQVIGNLIDVAPDDVQVGLRVAGTWTKALTSDEEGGIKLLHWQLADDRPSGRF